ncbi:MAG: Lrp/AsnC family transcriptional regulator, partial [Candidatus Saliniplasma sp.]
MDETDLKLCLSLIENSRTVYRELADKVELSVNAVHTRIQNLIDAGIIDGFNAYIGLKTLKESFVLVIHGHSRSEQFDELVNQLSEDEYTFMLVSTSDDYLYIHGLLPNIFEMSHYVEYISKVTEIEEAEVFLPSIPGMEAKVDFEFKTTDYEIIHSLHEDSRKSFSDIADEIEVSTKTVRRRIKIMEDAGVIDYSIRWYPVHSDDFIGILHGFTKSQERDKILAKIKKDHFPNVFQTVKSSNHPSKVFINLWSKNLKGIHKIMDDIEAKEYFESSKIRMFYDIEYFNTWREDLLEEKVEKSD